MNRPLPEAQWLWRRLLVWAATSTLLVQIHRLVSLTPPQDVAQVMDRLLMLIALLIALYLIGPTAEHIVALVRAWKGNDR